MPEPDFEQRGGQWVVTLWRDWLTEEVIQRLNINERQRAVVLHMKVSGRITTSEYVKMTSVSESTALRELRQMVRKGILEKVGTTGRGAFYSLAQRKSVRNPLNPSYKNGLNGSRWTCCNGPQRGQTGQGQWGMKRKTHV